MERMNCEIVDSEKTMRSLKVDASILKGIQIYHNYRREHQGLQENKTPAEKAGIQIEGDNKGVTIIQKIKNQIMVNNSGFIIHKIGYNKGRKHDYDIYKENHPTTPKQIVNVFDLGYLGVEKDIPEQLSALHYRKKRNQQELPAEEKEYNKNHAKRMIIVEHTIWRLKKYRIQSEVFRNKLRYNKISGVVSGLVNYRIINQHH